MAEEQIAAIPRTVSALIERDGAVLLVQEQAPGDLEPTWMLPGGRVEDGEPPEAALRRELAEETGLRLVSLPRLAFSVTISAMLDDLVGEWEALTYVCEVDGALAPADPDGLILSAAWVARDEALASLEAVEWYDSAPLRAFLAGTSPSGSRYRYALTGRRGAATRSVVELVGPNGT
ncbi:MAG TPA: NUDIX hydrolase [Candidatus Limnocylindria bacterium]|nr:NUDIX hydrolase [Candidatus Limnocylindria bacterium]